MTVKFISLYIIYIYRYHNYLAIFVKRYKMRVYYKDIYLDTRKLYKNNITASNARTYI